MTSNRRGPRHRFGYQHRQLTTRDKYLVAVGLALAASVLAGVASGQVQAATTPADPSPAPSAPATSTSPSTPASDSPIPVDGSIAGNANSGIRWQ